MACWVAVGHRRLHDHRGHRAVGEVADCGKGQKRPPSRSRRGEAVGPPETASLRAPTPHRRQPEAPRPRCREGTRRVAVVVSAPGSPTQRQRGGDRRHRMNRLPAYVRALSNDDLIWNRLKERGHRFRRSLGVSVFGCFEFAVLVNRLRTADRSEVARCLRLIESLATALRQTDDGDCVKCLVKLWLFAARIAGEGFQRDHIAISSWRKAWCHPVPSCGASPTSARRWTGTSSALVQKGNTCLTTRGSRSKWSARVAGVPS